MALVVTLKGNSAGPPGGLAVSVVGWQESSRAGVVAALGLISDPPLKIASGAPETFNAKAGAAEVLMVIFDGPENALLGYLKGGAGAAAGATLFALLAERSPALMRRVFRAGADEVLFLPLEPGDTARALLKVAEARRRREREGSGSVFSLASIVGGVGVSTLCVAAAFVLNYDFGKRVALVDLDLQEGGLGVFLAPQGDRTILPLARLDKKLNSIELEAALTKHASGVYLLAAPQRIEDSEMISDLTVAAVLDLMRQLFDFVLVDCGGHIDENAVTAWERSDEVIYVMDQSLGAARSAARFLELFARLGISGLEPRCVLNRVEARQPIDEARLEAALGRPLFGAIPLDRRTAERLQLYQHAGWESAGHGPLKRSVTDLVRRLAAGESLNGQRRGLITRLFGAMGAGA